MHKVKFFLKSFCVDLLLFLTFFGIGYFLKTTLAQFFVQVNTYQSQIQALEPGLANQSREALLSLDPLVGDFHSLVLKTFLLVLVAFPLVLYLLFVLTNTFLVSKKFSWKYYGKAFVFGIPLLVLFYLAMNSFFESFGNLLYSGSALRLFVLYILSFSLLSYIWYSLVAILAVHSLKEWKLVYKKFFPLYFVFLAFFATYLFLLLFVVYFVVSVLVGSFFGNDLWVYLTLFLAFLALLELFRLGYAVLLKKYLADSS